LPNGPPPVGRRVLGIEVPAPGTAGVAVSRETYPMYTLVLMSALGEKTVRACTHYGVSRADCERAATALGQL